MLLAFEGPCIRAHAMPIPDPPKRRCCVSYEPGAAAEEEPPAAAAVGSDYGEDFEDQRGPARRKIILQTMIGFPNNRTAGLVSI